MLRLPCEARLSPVEESKFAFIRDAGFELSLGLNDAEKDVVVGVSDLNVSVDESVRSKSSRLYFFKFHSIT